MRANTIMRLGCLYILFLAYTQVNAAPPPPQFVQFSPDAVMGALYYPDPEKFPNPHIGLLNMHRDGSRLSHISMKEMSSRGFIILGMNTVCYNNEAKCTLWENNALAVKQGIEYLRSLPGITKIVLLGGSGGGSTMSFYQAVAEKGIAFCRQPQKLTKCTDELADLPPADGIVFRDAHLGNGANSLMSLNPAVTNDEGVMNSSAVPKIEPKLDPFNPENGYKPDGTTSYDDDFKETYFRAQSERMNRLIDIALAKLKKIEAGEHRYPDDDAFIVPEIDDFRLMRIDLSVEHATLKPRKLLKNDGTIEDCCIVESVRPVSVAPETFDDFWDGTHMLTVRSFLSTRAVRSTHAMDEIDYCSSNNSTVCNVQNISAPILVTAMGGHYFVRSSETYYDAAVSKDKDFMVLEGAEHGITPCEDCMPAGQPYDGRYDNSVKNYYDYVAKWINARF